MLVCAALTASVAASEACHCGPPVVCEGYRKVEVVFVGRPIAAPPNRADGRVHFRLTHALKGVVGSEVSVPKPESYMDGPSCLREFDSGQDYLVFAMRNADGEIDLSPCKSFVWPLNDAADPDRRDDPRHAAAAAAFAESLSKPAGGGRVFGEVAVRVPFSEPNDDDVVRRVDGATVLLRGPQEERRTSTVNGQYEFTGLAPGAYSVSVTMPDGLPAAQSTRPPDDPAARYRFNFRDERERTERLTIEDARDCRYVRFESQFDGQVSGTVVGHDGATPGEQTVELFPTTVDPQQREGQPARVYTDARGSFRISHIPPGRYIVGINLRHGPSAESPFLATFYRKPGTEEPSIIELGNGAHVDLGVLRLPPPLPRRRITGTVRWTDGRPLRDVEVSVCESGSKRLRVYCDAQRIGDDGRFSLEMFAGTTYRVTAQAPDPRRWDAANDREFPPIGTAEVTVTLDGDVSGLRLVLVPRRDRDRR